MTFSTEIIRILDDLCRRFGIVIDWTSDNVIPYIEDLCTRYIQYEIYTSIAWCTIVVAIFMLCFIIWMISVILEKTTGLYTKDMKEMFGVCSLIALIVVFLVGGVQAFDIIECHTLPEKTIIEYISTLMNQR